MARITPQEALQRASTAQQQGMRLAAAKKGAAAEPPRTEKKAVITEYVRDVGSNVYLFRRGTDGLILPAEDEVTPILGEAQQAVFTDEMPPALEDWLQGYADEIDFYQKYRLIDLEDEEDAANADDGGGAEEPRKTVAAMCKAVWGQRAPYNNLLVFDGEVCLVGCWAVAVGIIMQYWGSKGYRRGCTATTKYKYSGNPHTIEALKPITVFDYQHLTATKPKTAEEKKAVATMLKYIGAASKLSYTADLTNAWVSTSTPFLRSRLRLGDGIKAVKDSNVGAAAFEKLVYQEIAAGRPVILRGADEKNNGGHFFVVDGYNATSKKYHINWGWDGSYNGNFVMSALTPLKGYDFSFGKYAIVGIQPGYKLGDANRDGKVNITDVLVTIDHSLNGTYDEAADVNSDGKVTVADHTPIVNHVLGKEGL